MIRDALEVVGAIALLWMAFNAAMAGSILLLDKLNTWRK